MTMLSRRHLLLVVLTLVGLAAIAAAQSPPRPHRVGYLTPTGQTAREDAFRQELRRLGYVEGKNLIIEYRTAEGQFERLPALAAELVGLKVDVIVGVVTQASLAAKKATSTIPIVMAGVGDPVGSGLVTSFARPGGNVTGTAAAAADVVGKQLELVRELRPKASRVGVLWNPANAVYQKRALAEAKAAAAKLKIRLQIAEARGPEEFDRAFATIAGQHGDALLILADPMFNAHAAQLAEMAVKHRLPAVSGARDFAERGVLMTYGPSFIEAHRLSAAYVDRVLKGARPADLPVEQVTKFELLINARTARVLGVQVPQVLLARADEVLP
jgi:ABC-type uncharacterized transport system substrate-binding protein